MTNTWKWRTEAGRWLIGVMLVLAIAQAIAASRFLAVEGGMLNVVNAGLFVLGAVATARFMARPSMVTVVISGVSLSAAYVARALQLTVLAVTGTGALDAGRTAVGVTTYLFGAAAISVCWSRVLIPLGTVMEAERHSRDGGW